MSKPKVTPEDAFYENIVLGLARTLANLPRICDLRWERRSPCEKSQILNWEQRHCVYLADDMKRFYLSTDGFALYWSFNYGPSDVRGVGAVHIPHLLQITLLRENLDVTIVALAASVSSSSVNSTQSATASPLHESVRSTTGNGALVLPHPSSKDRWGHDTPTLTAKTKIFEISNVNNVAKVCLVYETTGSNNPKIYLLELKTFQWHFLADNFTEYLRMAIAHLGLPYWELCFSNIELPAWTEQLYLLLAPHLLHEHTERRGHLLDPAPEHPHNIIDPNVFRARPKAKTQMSTSNHVNAKHKTNDVKSK